VNDLVAGFVPSPCGKHRYVEINTKLELDSCATGTSIVVSCSSQVEAKASEELDGGQSAVGLRLARFLPGAVERASGNEPASAQERQAIPQAPYKAQPALPVGTTSLPLPRPKSCMSA
jgi:hypothetical protein